MSNLQSIDLFAGAGGITQALKDCGFVIRLAVEFHPVFAHSYRLNHCRKEFGEEDHLIERDIKDITNDELTKLTPDLVNGNLDLLAGCPPCQGFSRQMIFKRKSVDQRNYLAFEYLRLVKLYKPKYIFLENVPGFGEDETIWPPIRKSLQSGEDDFPVYKLRFQRVDAASLGVPQRRHRFVMVGKRLDLCTNNDFLDIFEVPFPELLYINNPVTLRNYFESLVTPLHRPLTLKEAPREELHKYSHLGKLNQLRLAHTPPGKGRESWPEYVEIDGQKIRLKLKCHDNNPGYRDVYGRMDWDSVAPTITGGCLNISKGRFVHPTEDRPITAREAALIQTFPPDYKFFGNWTEVAQQIGNAVPVRMGLAFFDQIKKDMKK